VGAGPGDPELITVRGKRLLESCKVCVYAGSLVSDEVIALIPPGAKKYDSAAMSLKRIVEVYEQARDDGVDVVRLHSGDPAIYGAIREQMKELDRLGIDYDVTPGVSSFQAAAAALRAELTAPEVSQTIILTRAAGRTPVPEEQSLEKLAATKATLCVFLSIGQIAGIAATLSEQYGADCPAHVVYRASWPDQKIIKATLADIAGKVEAEGIKKTAMIVVGRALDEQSEAVSRLYAKEFSHQYRSAEQP